MKILNLKFKNINSLIGENEIDFTSPIFTNDGLFAITGRTGAGKSSILDAISLALYGETPRVKVSGSENEVMTRGEKEAWAEVQFEVNGKKWTASWKQERTKTGNLKSPERTVVDENGKIVADKISIKGQRKNEDDLTVEEKIRQIIGLNFEQFTKVILLAQGSFAAFLQADKNEKGDLLEKMTGTEIYGEISQKVFERSRYENQLLERIQIELAQIEVLTAEEIEAKNEKLKELNDFKKQKEERFVHLTKAENWWNVILTLTKEISDFKTEIPQLEELKNKKFEEVGLALKSLNEAKKELNDHQPIFNQVRALEVKLTDKNSAIEALNEPLKKLSDRKSELTTNLGNHQSTLNQLTDSLKNKQDWKAENEYLATLPNEYSAIKNAHDLLVEGKKKIGEQKSALAKYETDLNNKKAEFKNSSDYLKEILGQIEVKNKALDELNANLVKVLSGKNRKFYEDKKSDITKVGILLKDLIQIEKAIGSYQIEIKNLNDKLNQFGVQENQLNEVINQLKEQERSLKEKQDLLDENIKLALKVQSLEAHRHELKDGEACPLCGALEHPYADGNLPKTDERQTELAELKKQLEQVTKKLSDQEKQLSKLKADHENAEENLRKAKKELKNNQDLESDKVKEIKSVESKFVLTNTDELEQLRESKRVDYLEVESKLNEIDALTEQINLLKDQNLPTLNHQKEVAIEAQNKAESELNLFNQKIENEKSLIEKAEIQFEKDENLVNKQFSQFKVTSLAELSLAKENWENLTDEISKLEKSKNELNTQHSIDKKELESIEKQLDERGREREKLEKEKHDLWKERLELFGEKSVEQEENRLKEQLENSEKLHQSADETFRKAESDWKEKQTLLADKQKALEEKQAEKLSEESLEEIQPKIQELKEELNVVLVEIGSIQTQLSINSSKLEENKIKIDQKSKQEKIAKKWNNLNELIGSADGKKYRNFVQTLTFEHLIALSNRQLERMSDRYLIIRSDDKSNPFELSVIDKYQDSEIRTAKNLSGGEKFILSLAMALGLSNMAGRNMRIDTMFIDEGFGTLDADYLDVALSALSNLQSEGKMIGVISHLSELKDRIATHIEVIPSGGGYSKIEFKS